MKKKALISLGIVIAVIAIAGTVYFIGGNKEKDSTVNAVASIQQEETEENKETEIEASSIAESETEESEIEESEIETSSVEEIESSSVQEETETVAEESDIIPLDKVMYAIKDVNIREGVSTEYAKIGSLTVNQEVMVTGQSKSTDWYEIGLSDGTKAYVSNQYLSDTRIEVKPETNQSTTIQQQQIEQSQQQLSQPVEQPQTTPSSDGSGDIKIVVDGGTFDNFENAGDEGDRAVLH